MHPNPSRWFYVPFTFFYHGLVERRQLWNHTSGVRRKAKMKKTLILAAIAIAPIALASCGPKEFDPESNITVVTREDGSGTKGAFMEILGLKNQPDVSNAVVQNSTAAVLAEVENNQYAIAFDSLGYLDDSVKKLTVDGVEANSANIKSGEYSISRPLNVIYKEATITGSPLYTDYLSFLGSSQAQSIISDNGYVSIADGASEYEANPSLAGEIDISGSTSLQPLMILLAEEYQRLNPDVVVNVSGGGSGTGYSNAEAGVSAFGMISEEFNSEKAASCTPYTVAKDGIGIIVNLNNPLSDISKQDLALIYDSEAKEGEQITRWSQLLG